MPGKNIVMGLEGLWGARTDFNNGYGYDLRAQLTMRYSFDSADVPEKL
jgi:hypothetical protein